MASRKQIRGAGPRESPFCCLVPWLSWPRIPIFSPIRLSEPPPLRATHRASLLGHPCRPTSHWPVTLRCCLRKSPVVLSTVSYETQTGKEGSRPRGCAYHWDRDRRLFDLSATNRWERSEHHCDVQEDAKAGHVTSRHDGISQRSRTSELLHLWRIYHRFLWKEEAKWICKLL